MEAPKVFQFIGEMVTNATDTFVQPTISTLMSELKVVALTSLTLYLVFTGYAMVTGLIELPFWTFIKQCLKIMVITFFALNIDGYTNGVMEAIIGLEDGLSQIVNQAQSVDGKPLSIY